MLSARRLLFANAAAAKLSRGLTVTRTRSSLTDARYKLLCSGEGWRQHHSSLANPVLESNEASCIDRDVPAVIRGYATRWPAIKRWRNADYICEHSSWGFCDGSPGGGAIEVEVEFSNTGVFPSNGTERMTTKTLFDRLAASDRAGQHCADIYAANLSVGLLDGHGYGTTLLNDLKPLPPFNLFRSSHRGSKDAEPDPNVWIGRGSTTALHWDDQDNWIVQVCGVNEVRLYSRIHSDQIYPKSDSNQSHVVGIEPLEVLSEEKKAHVESQWPGFTNVPYEIVVLQPGDMLYIPVRASALVDNCGVDSFAAKDNLTCTQKCFVQEHWWHCIKARPDDAVPYCSHNISVNFWLMSR